MRKSFITLGLIAAAAFTLTNCAKEIDNPVQTPESAGVPFEIVASTADTKTANDGMSTVWVAGDAVNVFYAEAGTATYSSNAKFAIAEEDLDDNLFKGTVGELDETKSYDWYFLYPYNSNIPSPASNSSGWLEVGSKNTAVQTQNGNDSKAHIAGAAYPMAGVVTNVGAAETPATNMTHLTSLIEFNVKNEGEEPLTVTKISFTGTEPIVGTYYIDFVDLAAGNVVYTSSGTNYVSAVAVLEVEEGTAIPVGSSAKFYMAVKPFTAPAGEKISIMINDCIVEKTVESNLTFTAGKMKTVNVSYKKPESALEGIAGIKEITTTTEGTTFVAKLENAVVTLVNDKNAYIEDATAGILVYVTDHGLKAGDKLTGTITGTAKLYNGLREITALDYSAATVTEGAEIPETILTVAQLNADFDKYENMRIKIENAEVVSGALSQNDATIATYKKVSSITGYDLYNYVDAVGYPGKYNTKLQLQLWEDAVVKGASKTVFTGFAETLSVGVGATVENKAVASSGAAVSYVSDNAGVAAVDAEGNVTGVAAGTVTITASVAAYNGYPAATATCVVTVSADAVQTVTVVLSAASKPCDDFPATAAGVTTTTTYTIDGYDWTFSPSSGNKFSWYDNGKYILWGKSGGYILMPSVDGKSLKSVTILTGVGASTSVKVGVYEEDGSAAVSGGDAIQLNAKDTEFGWTLSGTQPGGRYQLRITSNHNAQLQTLTCVYE